MGLFYCTYQIESNYIISLWSIFLLSWLLSECLSHDLCLRSHTVAGRHAVLWDSGWTCFFGFGCSPSHVWQCRAISNIVWSSETLSVFWFCGLFLIEINKHKSKVFKWDFSCSRYLGFLPWRLWICDMRLCEDDVPAYRKPRAELRLPILTGNASSLTQLREEIIRPKR